MEPTPPPLLLSTDGSPVCSRNMPPTDEPSVICPIKWPKPLLSMFPQQLPFNDTASQRLRGSPPGAPPPPQVFGDSVGVIAVPPVLPQLLFCPTIQCSDGPDMLRLHRGAADGPCLDSGQLPLLTSIASGVRQDRNPPGSTLWQDWIGPLPDISSPELLVSVSEGPTGV